MEAAGGCRGLQNVRPLVNLARPPPPHHGPLEHLRAPTGGLSRLQGPWGGGMEGGGPSQVLAVGLAAPTPPEAVRISGDTGGSSPSLFEPIYLFLRLKNVEPEVPTTV